MELNFDPVIARVFVQLTARLSAILLSVSFLVASHRIAGRPSTRTTNVAIFAAFLVSDTIHFACVWWLSAITHGATIGNAGGWPAVLLVAALFYGASSLVIASKRRRPAGWTSGRARLREVALLAGIWLGFFPAFAVRAFQSTFFAAFTLLLLYTLLRFGIGAFGSTISQADRRAAESV